MVHDNIEVPSAADIREISECVETDCGGAVTKKFMCMFSGTRLPDVFKAGNSNLVNSLALARGAL